MANERPKISISFLQLCIVLATHMFGCIWLVSQLAFDVEHLKNSVEAIGAEQLKRSENVWESKVRLDGLRREIDRLEVRLNRLEQR